MLFRQTLFCRFLSLHIAFDIFCGTTAIHVFYRCRDNPIQYYGSDFIFNCSNTSEVIYVQSAIIGFTSKYKADNNLFECPITADTCTNTTKEPSTLCDGLNECTLAQRILLYEISGLKCSLNGTTSASDIRSGNFINVNYSCISRDLCSPVAGFNGRYTCSMPSRPTSPSTISLEATSSLSFSTTERFAASTDLIHLHTNGTDATRGLSGSASNVNGSTQPLPTVLSKKPQLGAGAIAGILVAAVVTVAALIGLAVYALRKRKKRKREANNNPLPRAEDLTDPPQGGRFSHQPQPHSSFVGSLNEVQKDDAAYEKLSRPSELSPVYYNLASPDNNYQRLQITN